MFGKIKADKQIRKYNNKKYVYITNCITGCKCAVQK